MGTIACPMMQDEHVVLAKSHSVTLSDRQIIPPMQQPLRNPYVLNQICALCRLHMSMKICFAIRNLDASLKELRPE